MEKSCKDCMFDCKHSEGICYKFCREAEGEACHYLSPECAGQTKFNCGYWNGIHLCPQATIVERRAKSAMDDSYDETSFELIFGVGELFAMQEMYDSICHYEIHMNYQDILVVLTREQGWDVFLFVDKDELLFENILSSDDCDVTVSQVEAFILENVSGVLDAHLAEDDDRRRPAVDDLLDIRYTEEFLFFDVQRR